MVSLRRFEGKDAEFLSNLYGISKERAEQLIGEWETLKYGDRYFEMFAVVREEKIVGTVSLYEHSESVVSAGPEIFGEYRRKGYGAQALELAVGVAKKRGYRVVLQQVRADNVASLALHKKLGFETDNYIYKNRKGNDVLIFVKPIA